MNNPKGWWRNLHQFGGIAIAMAASLWAFDPITDGSGIYVITWDRGPIPVQNNLPTSSTLSDGTNFRSSMDVAIADWNDVIGNVQFEPTHGSTGSYLTGNDANEIALDNSIGGFSFGSSTLAVTLSYTDGGNYRVEADVVFNSGWNWDSYRGPLQSGAQDARRVAIHELGHVLGLDHPDQASPAQNVSAVMNSIVSDVDGLLSDDIEGGQFLYGAPGVPPANDDFASAIEVVLDGDGAASLTGSNVQSSSEDGEPILDLGAPGGRSVWWKWTAAANGLVEVSTLGSRFDTVLGVFSGTGVAGLAGLGITDDIDPGVVRTSRLSFLALGGQTYYFMVDGWDGLEGGIVLNVQVLAAPPPIVMISEHRIIAPLGGTMTLSVSGQASIAGSLSYQWHKDNRPIPGETGTTFSVSDFTNEDAGAYTAEVIESGGTSGYATAFVLPNYANTQITTWGTENTTIPDPIPTGLTDVVALAVGETHALALRANGTVVGWGGQNLSSRYDVDQEVPPVGLDQVVAIAAGRAHSLALRSDGTVVAWGGKINSLAQVPEGLSGVVAIAAGYDNSAALLAGGSVVVWGFGGGTALNTLPRDVVEIAMDGNRGFTLHSDGTVKQWTEDFLRELSRPDLPASRTFSASWQNVLAIGFDERVYQASGETGVRLSVPEAVWNVTSLEAGGLFLFGVKADGTVVGWDDADVGRNLVDLMPLDLVRVVQVDVGEIGAALSVGSAVRAPTIVRTSSDVSVTEGESITVTVKVGGDNPFTFVWKKNGNAVINDGRIAGAGTSRLVVRNANPDDAGDYTLVVTNAAGEATSTAVRVDVAAKGVFTTVPLSQVAEEGETVEFLATFSGTGDIAYQWLQNELPIPGETRATLTIANAALMDAGRYALRAVDDRGEVWTQCELIVAAADAVAVTWDGDWGGIGFPAAPVPATDQSVAKVSILKHGLALLANGEILNIRSIASDDTELPAGLTGVVDIAVGEDFAVALLGDGTVVAWGKNDEGQTDVPAGLAQVVAVEASHDYAMALRSDGTLVSWGNPTVVDLIPTERSDIVEFSAWSGSGVLLHRDRSVSSWGNTQSPPEELIHVLKISAGPSETVALLGDGTVQNWTPTGGGLHFDPFSGLENAVDLYQGLSGGIVIKDDGSLFRWNYQGTITDDVPLAVVNAVGGEVGDFFAAIIRAPVPEIAAISPATQSVAGDEVLLTLDLTVVGASVVEWFRNGETVQLDSRISLDLNGSLRIRNAIGSDTGDYTVRISNAAGEVVSAVVELRVGFPPEITGAPESGEVFVGDEFSFSVVATNEPLTYQWNKDGVPVVGAISEVLLIAEVTADDAGGYTVVIGNAVGSVTSAVVELVVLPDFGGNHSIDGSTSISEGQVTISNRLVTNRALLDVTWSVLLPDGWTYLSDSVATLTSRPEVGASGLLDWVWAGAVGEAPEFSYTLQSPSDVSGVFELSAMIGLTSEGSPLEFLVQPDPLKVGLGLHSADLNGDMRLSLSELLRVIELYNTRFGSTRTGRYSVSGSSVDGFTPDGRSIEEGTVPVRFHRADVNRDGRLSLSELLRVIELYNVRSGSTRTGAYRISGESTDGFAPAP